VKKFKVIINLLLIILGLLLITLAYSFILIFFVLRLGSVALQISMFLLPIIIGFVSYFKLKKIFIDKKFKIPILFSILSAVGIFAAIYMLLSAFIFIIVFGFIYQG
jgi:hypothetical protein